MCVCSCHKGDIVENIVVFLIWPRTADRQGATRTWRHPAPAWWWVSSAATGTLTAEGENEVTQRKTRHLLKARVIKNIASTVFCRSWVTGVRASPWRKIHVRFSHVAWPAAVETVTDMRPPPSVYVTQKTPGLSPAWHMCGLYVSVATRWSTHYKHIITKEDNERAANQGALCSLSPLQCSALCLFITMEITEVSEWGGGHFTSMTAT